MIDTDGRRDRHGGRLLQRAVGAASAATCRAGLPPHRLSRPRLAHRRAGGQAAGRVRGSPGEAGLALQAQEIGRGRPRRPRAGGAGGAAGAPPGSRCRLLLQRRHGARRLLRLPGGGARGPGRSRCSASTGSTSRRRCPSPSRRCARRAWRSAGGPPRPDRSSPKKIDLGFELIEGSDRMSDESRLREDICRYGRSLFERGLTPGSSGNISLRLPDGGWLVTPTNASLGFLDPARISAGPQGRLSRATSPPRRSRCTARSTRAAAKRRRSSTCTPPTGGRCGLDAAGDRPASGSAAADALLPDAHRRHGAGALLPTRRPAVADAIRGLAGRYSSVLLANHGPVVAGTAWRARSSPPRSLRRPPALPAAPQPQPAAAEPRAGGRSGEPFRPDPAGAGGPCRARSRVRVALSGLCEGATRPLSMRERVGVRDRVFPVRSHPSPCPSPARARGPALRSDGDCPRGRLRLTPRSSRTPPTPASRRAGR